MRAFSGSLITLGVAACLSWVGRLWLLEFWLSPLREIAAQSGVIQLFADQTGVFVATLRVVVATALLVTVPVFSAEVWLLVCRKTRRLHARRLTLPFAAMSAVAMVLALWLVRRVEVPYLVAFL